jgi:hypothetical protein
MSGFLFGFGASFPHAPGLGWAGLTSNDDSIQPSDYRTGTPFARRDPRDSDVLWPRSSFTGGIDANSPCPYIIEGMHQMWAWDWPETGTHVPKKVIGQTLDASGAPNPGCTVKLFNTATGLLVDTQTVDSAGYYQLTDPNNVACFVVAYEAGSPDTAGTTVNTLTGV